MLDGIYDYCQRYYLNITSRIENLTTDEEIRYTRGTLVRRTILSITGFLSDIPKNEGSRTGLVISLLFSPVIFIMHYFPNNGNIVISAILTIITIIIIAKIGKYVRELGHALIQSSMALISRKTKEGVAKYKLMCCSMSKDFFLAFAGHAHTQNGLAVTGDNEKDLRKHNKNKEAHELAVEALNKLEEDISNAGFSLTDVKLLVLYLSYRGDTEKRDEDICRTILKTIEERFEKAGAREQIRLIGHTTSGEIENEDIELAKRQRRISGIGYNGLSLLALVTDLPIGVAHSGILKDQDESKKNGEKMIRDALFDLESDSTSKEHLDRSKILFVLSQGGKSSIENLKKPKVGFEHFLAEGIVGFMRTSPTARVNRVFGGSSGDGWIGRVFRQFYKEAGRRAEFQMLDDEAVCALIPILSEVSIGCDASPVKNIEVDEKLHKFQFATDENPDFMYISKIDNESPPNKLAHLIYVNEAQRASEQNEKLDFDEDYLLEEMLRLEGFPINPPVLPRYAFAFPTQWLPVCPIRTTPDRNYLELTRPIRSNGPIIMGKIVEIDSKKVNQGARTVCEMLREDRRFNETDITLIVSCASRRLVEEIEEKKDTEAEALKDKLHTTQLLGFLSYGELSINQDLQPPYHYNFACWGITIRSKMTEEKQAKTTTARAPMASSDTGKGFAFEQKTTIGISKKGLFKEHMKKSTHPLSEISEKKESRVKVGPGGRIFSAESKSEEVKKFDKKEKRE